MTQWYYRDFQSKKIGPLSTEEFEGCIADGAILPGTRVWRSGLNDWTTYEALRASDANCVAVATGPHSSTAPQSSSRSLASMPDASALHRRHDVGVATPASTSQQFPFEPCHGCGEEMPSHLFGEYGSRRLCGSCILKAKAEAVRERLRDAKGPDAHWFVKRLLLLVLVALAIAAARIGLMEMGSVPSAAKSLPVPESLAR